MFRFTCLLALYRWNDVGAGNIQTADLKQGLKDLRLGVCSRVVCGSSLNVLANAYKITYKIKEKETHHMLVFCWLVPETINASLLCLFTYTFTEMYIFLRSKETRIGQLEYCLHVYLPRIRKSSRSRKRYRPTHYCTHNQSS